MTTFLAGPLVKIAAAETTLGRTTPTLATANALRFKNCLRVIDNYLLPLRRLEVFVFG